MSEPLFLFSLPRAGSTLTQRLLAAHPAICSAAEPWILLPLFHALDKASFAEYNATAARRAVSEFCAELPGGAAQYRAEAARMAARLYNAAAEDGARYFLDKTPRYALIAEEILTAFPEARILLLWRNPLAVAASMIRSFSAGRWNLHHFHVDLFEGLDSLCRVYARHPERFHVLRYEELVRNCAATLGPVFDHLGLPDDPGVADRFGAVRFAGSMGDKTGVRAYADVTCARQETWPQVFATPLRRRWARRYLHWLGEERLALMGYSQSALRAALEAEPMTLRHIAPDVARMSYGALDRRLNLTVLRARRADRAGGAPLFPLS